MSKWPEHLVICDPWSNITCPAKDYREQFDKKMGKWRDDGKMISYGGKFRKPTYKPWLAMFDHKIFISEKRKGENEKLQFFPIVELGSEAQIKPSP